MHHCDDIRIHAVALTHTDSPAYSYNSYCDLCAVTVTFAAGSMHSRTSNKGGTHRHVRNFHLLAVNVRCA